MSVAFADADDLATRWRPLSDSEVTMASALLYDASLMIRAQYPEIDDEIISGAVDPGILVAVVTAMVKTAMIGATGATQQSQTVGPYSTSTSYANPTGNLFITAAMDQMIRGYQPAGMSVGFSNTTCHVEEFGPAIVYGPLE